MTEKKEPKTNKQDTWFSALTPTGQWAVRIAAIIIVLLALWAACTVRHAPPASRASSLSALISSIASLVALFVAASTAGQRRLDSQKEQHEHQEEARRRALLLHCTVEIQGSDDSPTAHLTFTNYGSSTFTNINCFLAGHGILSTDDSGHVQINNPQAESAFRDWRDAPIGTHDEAAMQRVKQGFLGPRITALGPGAQITVMAEISANTDANFRNLRPIISEYTDLEGARWEREDMVVRRASEFDENGKHRWFRRPVPHINDL